MNVPPVTHISYLMILLAFMLLGPTIYFIVRARRGKMPKIRRIPGIDAIDEAVGRATELGKPIVFSTGLTGLSPLLYACLGILTHIGKRAARMGTRVIVPQNDYEVMPIVEEVLREAYRDEGKLEQFNPEDIRFLSTTQFAFASGYMGIVHREKAAACFMFGNFAAESLILAEAGQQVGAMQVAGTTDSEQVPYFITSCDYTLIGEEVYAAGAYLSQDPNQLGGLRGQDVAKMGALATVGLGLLFGLFMTLFKGDSAEGVRYNSPYTVALYAKPASGRCLASFEASGPFRPAEPPAWESLNPDITQVSGDINDSVSSLARSLGRLEGTLRESGTWLRTEGAAVKGEHARAAVDELIAYVDAAAERVKSEASRLSQSASGFASLDDDLRSIEREVFVARWRPKMGGLAAWAATWGEQDERDLVKAATSALEALGDSTSDDALAATVETVRAAYESVCERYCELLRARVNETERLAEERKYALGALPLALDASESIDGDSDPLMFSWRFDDADEEAGTPSPAPTTEHAFEKLGAHTVTLTVSDKEPSKKVQVAPSPAEDSAVWRLETAVGTELQLSWPLPADAVAGTAEVTWAIGEDGATGLTATHSYAEAGSYVMTVSARYDVFAAVVQEVELGSGAREQADPDLEALRENLAEVFAAIEKKVERVQEHASGLAGNASGASARFPKDAESAKKLAEWLGTEAERAGAIAEWADALATRAANIRATSEVFGAAPPTAAEEGTAAGPAEEPEVRAVEKQARLYWTVEEEHTHSLQREITILEAAEDVPPPWSYTAPGEPAAGEGTSE
jgi:hypothetical protein